MRKTYPHQAGFEDQTSAQFTDILVIFLSMLYIRATAQSDQSSLCAQWVAKDSRFLHVDSEDLDQPGCTSFCWFCHVAAHI